MINIQLKEIKTKRIDYHYSKGDPSDVKVGYKLEEKPDDLYDFTLMIKFDDDAKNGLIRTIEVAMSASLKVTYDNENDKQSLLLVTKNTGASILFPYIRTLLTSLTTNDTNGKLIVLPVTNVASLIEEIDKKQAVISEEKDE